KNEFPWGKQWPPPVGVGNYPAGAGQRRGTTMPVGSFKANALGLYDLGGNVWEWCSDTYKGGSSGTGRDCGVLRGGSWATSNHFDRVAHFGFGFVLAFPVRELLLRFSGIRRGWSFWIAAGVILAVGGLFEILESMVAEIVAPGKGVDWLGGQGDEWDAQNDMLSAFLGALAMMAAVAFTTCKEPRT